MLIIQASRMKDVFGQALLDYYHNSFEPPLLLHNEYGDPEPIPLERFFADQDEFSDLELFAIQQIRGKTLDVGAATGRHALYLQEQGIDVTTMDISHKCGVLMKELGLAKIIIEDIYSYNDCTYDTIYMLMNGIGIAGNIENLIILLNKLKTLMTEEGQLLIDSSDISYIYDEDKKPGDNYFGELMFRHEYKGVLDEPVYWLYIDQEKLIQVADFTGWNCQIIFEDETGAYLARLNIK